MTTTISRISFESPIGRLGLYAHGRALVGLSLHGDSDEERRQELAARFGAVSWRHDHDGAAVLPRLAAYFSGRLDALDAIAVELGGTPFQAAVWQALRRIPVGATCSYRELAAAIGRPLAVRAVGSANGKNPVALVVPCHRVIAADGSLGGYGGGLPRKRWLLAHEGAWAQRPTSSL